MEQILTVYTAQSYSLGLKMLIHAPFRKSLGHISPKKMSLIVQTPKRTVHGLNHVI